MDSPFIANFQDQLLGSEESDQGPFLGQPLSGLGWDFSRALENLNWESEFDGLDINGAIGSERQALVPGSPFFE